jgi:hypothetical protein
LRHLTHIRATVDPLNRDYAVTVTGAVFDFLFLLVQLDPGVAQSFGEVIVHGQARRVHQFDHVRRRGGRFGGRLHRDRFSGDVVVREERQVVIAERTAEVLVDDRVAHRYPGRQLLSVGCVVLYDRGPVAGSISWIVDGLRIGRRQTPLSDAHVQRCVILSGLVGRFRRRTRRFRSEGLGDFRVGLPRVLRKSRSSIPLPLGGRQLLVGRLLRRLL